MRETFPNDYGLCECTDPLCNDVFDLCSTSFSLQVDLFDGTFSAAGGSGPVNSNVPNFLVYSFNGLNTQSNNWLELSSGTKSNFLQATDDFTFSVWIRISAVNSAASYILACELGTNRYFSLYDASTTRMILYYFRDRIDTLPAQTGDDGFNSQVALSFYYDPAVFPSGLRDNQWHFFSITVNYPSVFLEVDGRRIVPTQGNYRNQFDSQVLLNRLTDGTFYEMPAPILTKSVTQIDQISCKLGGSARNNRFSLFGEMRQPTVTDSLTDTQYRCIASCNEYIDVDVSLAPSLSFEISYDPVRRVLEFSSSAGDTQYALFLQSLVFISNGFLPPEEQEESRQIDILITDESGFGNTAVVTITGRSNQIDPILDANGDQVPGIDFSVLFREGDDFEVPIISDQAFFFDPDIDARVESVTVTLTNSQLGPFVEHLVVSGSTTDALSVVGSFSNTITISVVDPSRVTPNSFLTALISIRYVNSANEPLDIDRIIEFSVSDGLRTNNPPARTTVIIQTFNDPPVVDLNGPTVPGVDGNAEYLEADPATLISPNMTISDEENQPIVGAIARIGVIFDPGFETISVDSSVASAAGISCSPSSCSGTELTLSGVTSIANYQGVLRTLRYLNLLEATDLPNLRDREIFVSVSDSDTTSDPTVRILLDFIPVNPRVIIELDTPNQNYSVLFREAQGTPVSCVNLVRFVDTSILTLESVVVSIRPNLPPGVEEDLEMISLTSTSNLTVSIEINTALKRITFSQTASVDEYRQAINRVLYVNNEDEPFPINRFVDFLVIPGGGAPNGTAHTNITIENINDQIPVCDPSNVNVPVREDTLTSSVIHTLRATDGDIGIDGDIFYTMVAGDASLFAVSTVPDGDEQNGEVILLGALDRETQDMYDIEIEVCDFGVPQLCCSFNISIEVTDANDLPPVFEQPSYEVNVTENNGTDLITFTITDGDLGINAEVVNLEIDPSTYNPRAGCMGNFQPRVNAGVATLATSGLDFEEAMVCRFTVVATDGGTPSLQGEANVTVQVINVDDFSPQFSFPTYQFPVEEENSFPLVIERIQATDVDSPIGSLMYSLSPGSTVPFSVEPISGNVSILIQGNRSIETQYTFQVVVTDPAGNTDLSDVIVNITAINNDPPELDLNVTDTTTLNAETPVTFIEEGPAVNIITDPLITDPDDLPLTITMIRVAVANSGSLGNEILSTSADPSLYSTLTFTAGILAIQPAIGTGLADWYDLLRSINYQNTEDEFSSCRSDLYPCVEGAFSRTLLFTVNDGRFDSNVGEAYVVFESVNDAPLIDLDSFSAGLDFATEFGEGQGAINIINVNGFIISDDDNTNLTTLSCILSNPQDGVDEFLLIDGPSLPSSLTFAMSANRYEIVISGDASIADYRTAVTLLQYNSVTTDPSIVEREIQFTVSDGLLISPIATTRVSFNTTNQDPELDLDSTSPEVNVVTIFIEQGGPITLAGDAELMDMDNTIMQELEVTLFEGDGPQEVLAFNQLSLPGTLTSSYIFPTLRVSGQGSVLEYTTVIKSITYNNLDSEIASNSTRRVRFIVTDASDGSSDPVFADVQIQPVDDNSPVFRPFNFYIFSIEENSARNTLVGEVMVSDLDLPPGMDIPIFSFISATPTFGTSDFSISNNPLDPYQGLIVVNDDLDFDGRATTYEIQVQASSGTFSTVATVTINIINLPDINPIFTVCPLQFTVVENEIVSTPLMPPPSGCIAVDPDNLDNITYFISGNIIGGLRLVNINPSTGVIFVDNNINREIVGVDFTVIISAVDSAGSVSQNSTIVITGENEFPPTFSQPIYSAMMFENAEPSRFPIVTVAATDADEVPDINADPGFVSRITYSLSVAETTPTPFFSINTTTGAIFQEEVFNFEAFRQFSLTVTASDNDLTDVAMVTTVPITIGVRNINDEPPLFVNLENTIEVLESHPVRVTFYTVMFDDPDIDSSLQLLLSPTAPEFLLNSATGELSSIVVLDAEVEPRSYTYNLTLTDINTDPEYANTSMSVSEEITIVVVDVNDNIPQFTMSIFEGNVTENEPVGVAILQVFATDNDYGLDPNGLGNGNNVLRFSLSGDPINTFVIDPVSGVITKVRQLDREEQAVYEFRVVVQDSPLLGVANSNEAIVRITVIDVNEFPPQVDPRQYYVSVPEDTVVPSTLDTSVDVSWNYQSKLYNYVNMPTNNGIPTLTRSKWDTNAWILIHSVIMKMAKFK